ncbi:hypothetical protein [Azospirillum argentinense]|uniref:Uncharacterized protein n=1 Tax=Azospirillum argentinense TaxID=2970906 RepID=A0A5B0KRA0_9PROT|nr:hypothetical protein [Azospirillum argentinense]KAA1054445.1 hypothetical protein FH063_006701 [Azospirillum argentinense]
MSKPILPENHHSIRVRLTDNHWADLERIVGERIASDCRIKLDEIINKYIFCISAYSKSATTPEIKQHLRLLANRCRKFHSTLGDILMLPVSDEGHAEWIHNLRKGEISEYEKNALYSAMIAKNPRRPRYLRRVGNKKVFRKSNERVYERSLEVVSNASGGGMSRKKLIEIYDESVLFYQLVMKAVSGLSSSAGAQSDPYIDDFLNDLLDQFYASWSRKSREKVEAFVAYLMTVISDWSETSRVPALYHGFTDAVPLSDSFKSCMEPSRLPERLRAARKARRRKVGRISAAEAIAGAPCVPPSGSTNKLPED